MNALVPRGAVLFAGGGGSSLGMLDAGVNVMLGINHNPVAIRSHAVNHPDCHTVTEDVFSQAASPYVAWDGRLDVLWLSPSCQHFSKARGSRPDRPLSAQQRAHADIVFPWAEHAKPAVIFVENVEEFRTWGPLLKNNLPDPARKGEFFREWCSKLTALGYRIEWRILRAHEYGTPTIRSRFYLIARRDGQPIVWPSPTHGPRLQPYHTAAECVDFTDLGRSIFGRSKPLAEKTQRRIAQGLIKFVLRNPRPFIVPTVARPHEGQNDVVLAWLAKHYTGVVGQDMQLPLGTVTARDHHSLCTARFTPPKGTHPGEALCAAFIVSYYSGGGTASSLFDPLPAIVTKARHGLVTAKFQGEPYVLTDITMRMLKPHELKLAQGFPADYEFTGTIEDQIAQIGNAVCPPVAKALVKANMRSLRFT